MSEKYFGAGATLTGDAAGLTLFIPAATLLNPGLLDSPVGASEDKLALVLLNCLYSSTKSVADNPLFLISSQGVFPGRTAIGEDGQIFDTFDLTIQARTPATGVSDLPDPDNVN